MTSKESDPVMLIVDAGNTRIKWGVRDGVAWRLQGSHPTDDSSGVVVAWKDFAAPARIVASNVAGAQVLADLRSAAEHIGAPLTVITSRATQLGVRNSYANPAQLGTDRWAALIAAHALARGPKLVVNAGTALTVDVLSADGTFLGGIIAPGPALMRRALDRNTADLRLAEGSVVDFPGTTADAITSGSIQAAAGAIERMSRIAANRLGAVPAILLAGGAAHELRPHLPSGAAVHDNLVLDGLALIARDS